MNANSGFNNTANGDSALAYNTTGSANTANGSGAMIANSTGSANTINGVAAMIGNTGDNNTATGFEALQNNTTGYENTAIGYQALLNNTAAGNTALGYGAGSNLTTGNDNIDIGNDGVAGDAGIIRIGRSFISATFIAGIYGAPASSGAAVFVNSDGQLGTSTSSRRFKDQIKPMEKASEALFGLNPVTFRYKKEIDPEGIPQFGLVAEEVEKVNPDLVVRGAGGKVYTVRYEAVNAMLLNEFLKEHLTVQELKSVVAKQEGANAQQRKDFQATITKLEAIIAQRQKEVKALTSNLKDQAGQIQKVSAQLEMSKPTMRLVANHQ